MYSEIIKYHEKAFFGLTTLGSGCMAFLAAILSSGETQWFLVTCASSVFMAGFLALTFKKPNEAINLVVGRCGISVFGGVFLTKLAVHYLGLATSGENVINLGGLAGGVCIITYTVGWALIKVLETKAPELANKIFKIGANKIPGDSNEKDP